MYNVTMKELPESERPMEKMMRRGSDGLSDAELLAIVIGTGTPRANAVELADAILRKRMKRSWLLKANVHELMAQEGIGQTKACRIVAGLSLGRRLTEQKNYEQLQLCDPRTVYHFFRTIYEPEERELFCVIFMDIKKRPIGYDIISVGTLSNTLVHPREVFRAAIQMGSHGLILSHNHPSGDPEPSSDDVAITKRLSEVGKLVGIPILDHVIAGDGCYVSFQERRLL